MWSTPLTKGKLIRGVVWMPSTKSDKIRYPFRPKEIRFLHAYVNNVPIDEICSLLNIKPEDAQKLLLRKKTKDYLQELSEMDAEVLTRSARTKIAKELLDVWDGKVLKSKQQLEAGKEFWSRVWPKPADGVKGGSEGKLEVHINVTALQEAVKRQEILEGEIVK